MDIRKFFGKRTTRDKSSSSSDSDAEKQSEKVLRTTSPELVPQTEYPDNDVGNWVGRASMMNFEKKRELVLEPWTPDLNYDFSKDAEGLKRKFRHQWLQMYAPWLVYSSRLKGAFCFYCVLFPATNVRGVLRSLVINIFNKYKDANEVFKAHASSDKHKEAVKCAKNFLDTTPKDLQIQSGHQKVLEDNKRLLSVIISKIVFCRTHDIALRGKESNSGMLLKFKQLLLAL